MKDFLLTALCYLIAVPAAIGARLLPLLQTGASYLWLQLIEPEQQPQIAAVVPLPVAPVPAVEPAEAATVKRTRKTSTARTTRKKSTATVDAS